MTNISPIPQTFPLVDKDGFYTTYFKRFLDQLLARVGGITGGVYNLLTPSAGSIVWDLNQSTNAVVVLDGADTVPNPINQVAGAPPYRLTVVQSPVGGCTITWGSAFKFPSGTPPALSAAANAVDELWFTSDGTNMKLCVLSKDLR